MVYTSDDIAQEFVAKYYINSAIPFVFSGVNADPRAYGFTGSHNVTGVLEQEHFVQSVQLLKEIGNRSGGRYYAATGRSSSASEWQGSSEGAGAPRYAA